MLPETRDLFRWIQNNNYFGGNDWIGTTTAYSRTFNGGNDNYLLVRLDENGGFEVRVKRHGIESVIDQHTGIGITTKGLKGHQEKQDRELALATYRVIQAKNAENYAKIVKHIVK